MRESKECVLSALLMSQFQNPQQVIIVNLAPAEIPKSGGWQDLAIDMGVLQASGWLPENSVGALGSILSWLEQLSTEASSGHGGGR